MIYVLQYHQGNRHNRHNDFAMNYAFGAFRLIALKVWKMSFCTLFIDLTMILDIFALNCNKLSLEQQTNVKSLYNAS